jgi:hypothetical protein
MLLQAIIGAGLENLENFCIGPLHLSITLWVSNVRIAYLDAQVFAVPLEGTTGELGSVVGDNPVREPKSANDGFDKFHYGLLVDFDHRGHFRPLAELVDGDVEKPVTSDGVGDLRQCVDLLSMKLACPACHYQLDSVLQSRRPVEAMPKGFTNQRAGRCMVPTLTSMDFCEQPAALLPGNAPH